MTHSSLSDVRRLALVAPGSLPRCESGCKHKRCSWYAASTRRLWAGQRGLAWKQACWKEVRCIAACQDSTIGQHRLRLRNNNKKNLGNHALGFPIGLSAPRGGSINRRRGHTEARTTGGATQPNFIIRRNERVRQGHGADGHSSRRTQARACAHRSVIRRAGRRGQGKRRERRRRGRAGVSAKPRLILTVRRRERQRHNRGDRCTHRRRPGKVREEATHARRQREVQRNKAHMVRGAGTKVGAH